MKCLLNGQLLDAAAAQIPATDRGFTLGDGIFETIRVRAARMQRLPGHIARLTRGAHLLGIPMPDQDVLEVLEIVRTANALDDGVLRLTLTRGSGPRGVLPPAKPEPSLLITAAPMAPLPPPARLIIASVTRRNEMSPLAGVKSLNYLDNILARQEAATRQADDAVLLNTQGRIAETSIANIFALIEGRLLTPPLQDGALPGVMRAAMLGQGAQEHPLAPMDLTGAEEIFLTSSLGIRPVRELENSTFTSFALAERLSQRLGESLNVG